MNIKMGRNLFHCQTRHREMKSIIYLFIIILILGTSSCEEYVHRKKVENLVKEWTGKTIVFDPEIPCISVMQDTVSCISDKPYKILLYTDAKGCESCKMQPGKWKPVIEEADSTLFGLLSFEFYFHPKKNAHNILFALRRDGFDYPVHIDLEDKLNKLNKFPTDTNYQCFLLNKDNQVILIGNPFTNPNIWKLYKQIISIQTQ
jgi:hypothetical protein